MPGICTSINATSGRCSTIAVSSSAPSDASPTTFTRPSASSSTRRPRLSRASSSARTRRTGALGSGPLSPLATRYLSHRAGWYQAGCEQRIRFGAPPEPVVRAGRDIAANYFLRGFFSRTRTEIRTGLPLKPNVSRNLRSMNRR